jgi:recombination protein RecT
MSEPTNTAGAIQKAAADAPKGAPMKPVDYMKKFLTEDNVKFQVERIYGEHADLFSANVLDLYASNAHLQECQPKAVLLCALKAAGLRLALNPALGQASIVPFKDHGVPKPTLIIGHHGYKQLALRTGQYSKMNEDVVYEGEFKSYDKLTGDLDISGEKKTEKIIGYFSWFRLLAGFEHAVYWTREKVIKHAERFSKSYNREDSAWKTSFDKMAMKTVFLQNVRGWGPLSVEMQKAFMDEDDSSLTVPGAPELGDENTNSTVIVLASEKQVDELNAILDKNPMAAGEALARMGYSVTSEVPASDYETVKKALQNAIK